MVYGSLQSRDGRRDQIRVKHMEGEAGSELFRPERGFGLMQQDSQSGVLFEVSGIFQVQLVLSYFPAGYVSGNTLSTITSSNLFDSVTHGLCPE